MPPPAPASSARPVGSPPTPGVRPTVGSVSNSPKAARKQRDAARTQADLLTVATEEFARIGYFGARVDEIAAKSATTKRMIYYYFGDKEGLFTAVLEKAYADIRETEQALDLAHMPPLDALTVLIRHTFDYHEAHPGLARLVASENALDASHLRLSQRAAGVNLPIIALVADLLARGRSEGIIVREVDPLDLHLMMTSMALFRITNAPTIEATFGLRMGTREHKERQIALVTEMVLTWLTTPDSRD